LTRLYDMCLCVCVCVCVCAGASRSAARKKIGFALAKRG